MFNKCILEDQLSKTHSVSYFFEEILNTLIWRIDLDGVTWFEIVATTNVITFTISSQIFLLRSNTLIFELFDMAMSDKVYTSEDISENFCLDLIHPKLNSSNMKTKQIIIEATTLVVGKLIASGKGAPDIDNTNETTERKLIKKIISKVNSHYFDVIINLNRDREFEDALITLNQRLNIS